MKQQELERQYVRWALETFRRLVDEVEAQWKRLHTTKKFFGIIEESLHIDDYGATLTVVPIDGEDFEIFSALREEGWKQEEYRNDENWIVGKNGILIQYSNGIVEIYKK